MIRGEENKVARKEAIYRIETDLMNLSLSNAKASAIADDLVDQLGDKIYAASNLSKIQTYACVVADYVSSVSTQLGKLLEEINEE